MEDQNLNETLPTTIGEETLQTPTADELPPPPQKTGRRRGVSILLWGLLGILILGVFIVIGGFFGYQQGISERTNYESAQVDTVIDEQYELGLQDMEAGNYEIARQRFEYIVQIDPNYPEVVDRLAEVLLVLNATSTPTAVPPTATPTPIPVTPTPDTRGDEELFVHAQNMFAEERWGEAIEALEALRKNNPSYKAIDIDGMFFVAYRNRGAQNIGAGNLEEGIYDLTLAERFGVLDTQANGYRTWARYYITGASFWGVDWSQAVYYFKQVAPQYPNMHDGTGWSASQRYVEALAGYGQWLGDQGKWCQAEELYHEAYELSGNDAYREARNNASDNCN